MIFNREPMRSFEIQSRRQRIKITFKNASQLVNSASRRRLLAYMRLASHALVNGVWLPPLPIYWDQLAECNWEIWHMEDYMLSSVCPQEISRQLQLRIIASFSAEHEELYWSFVRFREDEVKPMRPPWIR